MSDLTPMTQANELGESFEQALDRFRASLDDTRKHWAAYMLSQYPGIDTLRQTASQAVTYLEARFVQVNAIYNDRQHTIMSAPGEFIQSIAATSSFCYLTFGYEHPVAINDIAGDEFVNGHPLQGGAWGSWASVPLHVNGVVAGTICALESGSRNWNLSDQACLQELANDLSIRVSAWAQEQEQDE